MSVKDCQTCGFHTEIEGVKNVCQYCLFTGQPRGCKPGTGCTRWADMKTVKEIMKRIQTPVPKKSDSNMSA